MSVESQAIRLESLKVALALYQGKGNLNPTQFLSFAEEVYDFVVKAPPEVEKDSQEKPDKPKK
jgi:hypothetical protein